MRVWGGAGVRKSACVRACVYKGVFQALRSQLLRENSVFEWGTGGEKIKLIDNQKKNQERESRDLPV